MKNLKLKMMVGVAALSMAVAPLLFGANKTGYVTYSAGSTNLPVGLLTNVAQVIFPSDQNKVIRLVSVDMNCMTNTGTYSILGSSAQTRLIATNGLVTNLVVASTAGFLTNQIIIVQGISNDFIWQGVIYATNQLTNVWCYTACTNGFPTNAYVYCMADGYTTMLSSNRLFVGSECLYGAARRTPVLVRIQGTNSTVSATAKYDDYN